MPDTIHGYKFATMNDMHSGLCEKLIWAPRAELDLVTSVDVQVHNTISMAHSMEWDFDLKDLWLTKQRWNMLVRQYLDPDELLEWLAKCVAGIGLKGRGTSVLRTKVVKPRGGKEFGNRMTRRWGSCMLALSYKALPVPQITLHSRTSYLGYIAALDHSVAWMCARYLAKELDVPVESFRFVWYCEVLQWHNFKSLAYALSASPRRKEYRRFFILPEDRLSDEEFKAATSTPGLAMTRKWMQRVVAEDERGETIGDMTYNTYRRIRRRYHTEVRGFEYAKKFEGWSYWDRGERQGEQRDFYKAYPPLPHCTVHDLDFSAIGLPWATTELGPEYDGADMLDAMDEQGRLVWDDEDLEELGPYLSDQERELIVVRSNGKKKKAKIKAD